MLYFCFSLNHGTLAIGPTKHRQRRNAVAFLIFLDMMQFSNSVNIRMIIYSYKNTNYFKTMGVNVGDIDSLPGHMTALNNVCAKSNNSTRFVNSLARLRWRANNSGNTSGQLRSLFLEQVRA